MKFFSILFFFPLLLSADWVGSPSLPAIVQEGLFLSDRSFASFRGGIDGAYAFNEKLKFGRKERKMGYHSLHVEGPSYLGVMVMNLRERVEFYLQPGTVEFHAKFSKEINKYSRKSSFGFAGKAGARAIVIEIKDTTLGVDVHYRYFDGNSKKTYSFLADACSWSLKEWQIGVGISQKIRFLTPYAGIAIRQSKQKIPSLLTGEKAHLRANQKHKNGPYLGVIMSRGSCVLLGIEYHLYHESSLTLSLQMRL